MMKLNARNYFWAAIGLAVLAAFWASTSSPTISSSTRGWT